MDRESFKTGRDEEIDRGETEQKRKQLREQVEGMTFQRRRDKSLRLTAATTKSDTDDKGLSAQ